jgi:hypothetical protein
MILESLISPVQRTQDSRRYTEQILSSELGMAAL